MFRTTTGRDAALLLPPSEHYPRPYIDDIVDYVAKGGNLFLFGGLPFFHQTEWSKGKNGVLTVKTSGNEPTEDRRRLRIGWRTSWSDKSQKTPGSAEFIVAQPFRSGLANFEAFPKRAERFLDDSFLRPGDRLIPIFLGKEGDFEAPCAGIFKFDSDMKGAVIVNTSKALPVVATENDQGNFLAQSILLAFRFGVDRYFGYEFQSLEQDRGDIEHHFGMVGRQLEPKPAYLAYSALTRAFPDGSKIDRSLEWNHGTAW